MGKVLKLAGGVPSGTLKAPPNSCMPSKAKIRMNKKSRNNREIIERIELSSDITRFLRDDQYLSREHAARKEKNKEISNNVISIVTWLHRNGR